MNFPLATTNWLETNLNLEQLILVDVSMSKVVGKKAIEYEKPLYIPNSRRLDTQFILFMMHIVCYSSCKKSLPSTTLPFAKSSLAALKQCFRYSAFIISSSS